MESKIQDYCNINTLYQQVNSQSWWRVINTGMKMCFVKTCSNASSVHAIILISLIEAFLYMTTK